MVVKLSKIAFLIFLINCSGSRKSVSLEDGSGQIFAENVETISYRVTKDKNILCQIDEVANYCKAKEDFLVNKESWVYIYALGEGVDSKINSKIIPTYNNDNIEIFFDMKNDKGDYFDITGDDRQYRFSWGIKEVDGLNINLDGLDFAFLDVSDNAYNFEAKFPWETLEYFEPVIGKTIGFDIAISDNDGYAREGKLAWAADSDLGWRETHLYGDLTLVDETNIEANEALSILNRDSIHIDGFYDSYWDKASFQKIAKPILLPIDDEKDLSARFKLLWDSQFLYLFIEVKDDIKNYVNTFFDYGSIENSQGDIIWEMKMSKSHHAGGAYKNRLIRDSLFLKPGRYVVNYVTDESHSFNSWDDIPPDTCFYGISIYQK